MKKVITMIVIMLIMSMVIPSCAWAQTYEEAGENNSSIIEELMDLDFAYDTDTGLWIFNATDEYDWGEKDVVSASYNLITNLGNMIYQEYEKEEDEAEYELTVTYNIDFKWYADEEEFGIVKCVIDANKFMNDITF